MAQLDFPRFEQTLKAFDFPRLFTEVLGWNAAPNGGAWTQDSAGSKSQTAFEYRVVSELGGVVALQVVVSDNDLSVWPNEEQRMQVWKHIANSYAENLLIFTDKKAMPSQSQWYWVKRDKHPDTGKPRMVPRRHEYFRGQPVELFASKLQGMVVELSELDATGRIPVLEAARRIANALDVEKTTKKFFTAYQQQHLNLLSHIHGIANERDKRWYASVLLNRLMFVWFMQKKGFLNHANYDYLSQKLSQHQTQAQTSNTPQGFYATFLNALFFEAFAKPEQDRSAHARALAGQIPYLNGGLFLHHKLELNAQGESRVGNDLQVDDAAFAGIFQLFASFTWHLDDTPGGSADEINPDVLGYIFEKYINPKAFGAYYTRPEITGYLAERSIHQLILERINSPAHPELGIKAVQHDTVPDMLARMDSATALTLVKQVLPSITILDPSVGSGAFLVAALKVMMNVYYAVVGRAELGVSSDLEHWIKSIQNDHASVGYYIKRRIVTDNLHGVDIMEEACEIAKLRLFLAMVASVRRVQDLEPLPNIDFNILPGNSLVGLMRVDAVEFNQKNTQMGLFSQVKPRPFTDLLAEKNRLLVTYRDTAQDLGKSVNLRSVRDELDQSIANANGVMNELLRDQFEALGVKYEQATWVSSPSPAGGRGAGGEGVSKNTDAHYIPAPPAKLPDDLRHFARALRENQTDAETLLWGLLRNRSLNDAKFRRQHPHTTAAGRYILDFYCVEQKLAIELDGGHHAQQKPKDDARDADLATHGIRTLRFWNNEVLGQTQAVLEAIWAALVCLPAPSPLTPLPPAGEGDLTAPSGTVSFPAAFMRHDVAELARFPQEGAIQMDVDLIRKLSPGSYSVMEFKGPTDITIAKKMLQFPLLGETIAGAWNLKLSNEFHMTNDSHLFKTEPGVGRLPLWEGKQFWQFDANYGQAKYWLDETAARSELITPRIREAKKLLELAKRPEQSQQIDPAVILLNYQNYRVAFRSIAASTNERTMVAAILPPARFLPHSVTSEVVFEGAVVEEGYVNKELLSLTEKLFASAVLNSYVFDWTLRQMVTTNLSFSFINTIPVPRLTQSDPRFAPIAHRAALLTCTSPEFDELAIAAGLPPSPAGGRGAGGEGAGKHTTYGTTDPAERAKLRAELDGLVAHLYGLTEAEFVHILGTFPIVSDPVKVAAHNAYRDVARGLVV